VKVPTDVCHVTDMCRITEAAALRADFRFVLNAMFINLFANMFVNGNRLPLKSWEGIPVEIVDELPDVLSGVDLSGITLQYL